MRLPPIPGNKRVPSETSRQLCKIRHRLRRELNPIGDIESCLVDDLALCRLQLDRLAVLAAIAAQEVDNVALRNLQITSAGQRRAFQNNLKLFKSLQKERLKAERRTEKTAETARNGGKGAV